MRIAAFPMPFGRVLAGGPHQLVLRSASRPAVEVCFDGVQRETLPDSLATLELEQLSGPDANGRRVLLVRVGADRHVVEAEAVRIHEPVPAVFAASLGPYRLTPRELRVGLLLVRLLRLPGAARLLRWWHAHRTR